MKIAVVLAGTFMALAVSSPIGFLQDQTKLNDRQAEVSVPAWLPLPSTHLINSIEHSGEAGRESAFGTVTYDLPGDGKAEVMWLKEHLEARGYALEDRTFLADGYFGGDVLVSGYDASSGRRVTFVSELRPNGSVLRVTFEDPRAYGDGTLL